MLGLGLGLGLTARGGGGRIVPVLFLMKNDIGAYDLIQMKDESGTGYFLIQVKGRKQ